MIWSGTNPGRCAVTVAEATFKPVSKFGIPKAFYLFGDQVSQYLCSFLIRPMYRRTRPRFIHHPRIDFGSHTLSSMTTNEDPKATFKHTREQDNSREEGPIDRQLVEDDPKAWSGSKKVRTLQPFTMSFHMPTADRKQLRVLLLVAGASVMPMLSQSMYNPILNIIQDEFQPSGTKMAVSISLPVLWVAS